MKLKLELIVKDKAEAIRLMETIESSAEKVKRKAEGWNPSFKNWESIKAKKEMERSAELMQELSGLVLQPTTNRDKK